MLLKTAWKKLFPYVLPTARVPTREQSPVVAEVRLLFSSENASLLQGVREGGESFQDEKEQKEILQKKGRRGKLKLPLQHLKFPSSFY